ncbi:MAG: winged helix-turn-helix domain-containing protein [Janthinobacterium lividum]
MDQGSNSGVRISAGQARRIALAAQGFGRPPADRVDQGHLRRTIDRLGLHQIDSVNVLVRAHYLPAFSRLGAYDQALIDRAAWGRRSERRLFEYWAHEASLLPLDLHPLFRWCMARADRGEAGWTGLRVFAGERRIEAGALLAQISDRGPMTAADFDGGKGRGGWWEWGDTKRALEWLFWSGRITTATRRPSFARVYDLTERVIPAAVLDLPTPDERGAHRALIARSARTLGIATATDLRDYFHLGPDDARVAIASLVEEGILLSVTVAGWLRPAYLHRDAGIPRRIEAQALLAPFDPLIWERSRTEWLFGFRYRIWIYTPAAKRTDGYYVLPFLLGDCLVARVDLKNDRQASRLVVGQVTLEDRASADTMERLDDALARMAWWLGLERVTASTAKVFEPLTCA